MNCERRKLTDDELDDVAEALHRASVLHARNLKLYGDEAGDLVTIEEYDQAFCAMGLGFLGAHRRMLMMQNQATQSEDDIDLTDRSQVLPDDPTYCTQA